jgi:hypothetical protein
MRAALSLFETSVYFATVMAGGFQIWLNLHSKEADELCRRWQPVVAKIALEPEDERGYKFAPKARRRPSQSLTTNSRECQGMLARPRANSTSRAAYSA